MKQRKAKLVLLSKLLFDPRVKFHASWKVILQMTDQISSRCKSEWPRLTMPFISIITLMVYVRSAILREQNFPNFMGTFLCLRNCMYIYFIHCTHTSRMINWCLSAVFWPYRIKLEEEKELLKQPPSRQITILSSSKIFFTPLFN